MCRTIFCLLVLFTATTTALGEIIINGVFPVEGPARGGTIVRITGSGFSQICIICSPPVPVEPRVLFGDTASPSVTFIDANNLEAVTPSHLPGTVSVTVQQFDGSNPATRPNAFTYTGEPLSAMDAILFPIFLPVTNGAFGSVFETRARAWNKSETQFLDFYGLDTSCYLFQPFDTPERPVTLAPSGDEKELLTGCSHTTGRLFYVPKQQSKNFAANLRVSDISRQASSHGVEIPVVRDDDFSDERIALLNVPVDPRFRHTLRIYGLATTPTFVNVSINGRLVQIPLTPGSSVFEPAYAQYTDFPRPEDLAGGPSLRVIVDTPRGPGGAVPSNTPPIWAFISVTNNETQEITVITPQP